MDIIFIKFEKIFARLQFTSLMKNARAIAHCDKYFRNAHRSSSRAKLDDALRKLVEAVSFNVADDLFDNCHQRVIVFRYSWHGKYR